MLINDHIQELLDRAGYQDYVNVKNLNDAFEKGLKIEDVCTESVPLHLLSKGRLYIAQTSSNPQSELFKTQAVVFGGIGKLNPDKQLGIIWYGNPSEEQKNLRRPWIRISEDHSILVPIEVKLDCLELGFSGITIYILEVEHLKAQIGIQKLLFSN